MVEIRRLPNDPKTEDIVHRTNLLLDLVQGNVGGRFYFQNDDGIERDIRGGAQISTGNFAVKIRSGAGFHLDVRDSGDLASRLRVTDAQVLMAVNDIQIIGTTPRFTGEFSNATLANRLLFQSYIVNGETTVGALPNGTSTTAGWVSYNNSTPASATVEATMRAVTGAMELRAASPSGSYQPMNFYTNNTLQVSIATTGVATFTAAPVVPNTNPPAVNGDVTSGSQMKAAARIVGATGALGTNYNIASVTRNAAGDYTVTWDHDFVNATYGVQVTVHDNAAVLIPRVNGQATGSCDVHVRTVGGLLADPVAFSILAFGTLA